MSWHYSLALVGAFSEAGVLVTKSSVRLKETRTASRSFFDGRKRATCLYSPSGTKFDHLTVNLGMASSMLCLLDFHANPSVKQVSEPELTTNETSGPKLLGSLARYDPDMSSWRMCQPLFNTWEEYCPATWPVSATMLNGELFQRETQVPPTFASVGGVWPTPTARDWKDSVYCPNVPVNKLLGRVVWEGPDNEGRLNPDWVEWLMGMPVGWTSPDRLVASSTLTWLKDPGNTGEVPRLTSSRSHRASRLKALGNGQVPHQVELAWKVLTNERS